MCDDFKSPLFLFHCFLLFLHLTPPLLLVGLSVEDFKWLNVLGQHFCFWTVGNNQCC